MKCTSPLRKERPSACAFLGLFLNIISFYCLVVLGHVESFHRRSGGGSFAYLSAQCAERGTIRVWAPVGEVPADDKGKRSLEIGQHCEFTVYMRPVRHGSSRTPYVARYIVPGRTTSKV